MSASAPAEAAAPRGVILVVDDDPHIREVLRFALTKGGFTVHEAKDGREALARFEALGPDLTVLDIGLPELDGTEVCRRIRAQSRRPIIFLTAKDDEIDRVVGLELGGDDYVVKPFSPRELVARVKAVLRRSAPVEAPPAPAPPPRLLRHGRLSVDLDRFAAAWDGVEIVLTVTEMGILKTLLRHPGKVYSRDALMDGAYEDVTVVADRTIDSHVRRLRRKFADVGAEPVETVHGVGYRLGPCDGEPGR